VSPRRLFLLSDSHLLVEIAGATMPSIRPKLPRFKKPDASTLPLIRLYSIACFVSITMLCFGFDTGSVGSITTMPQFEATFSHLSEIKRGAIVSSMLAASAVSGFMAGNVADRISRKYTMASASKSALLLAHN
jgi:hypothetical protein